MTPVNYGLVGSRAANIYGREDAEPTRASDRLRQRHQQRLAARGLITPPPAGKTQAVASPSKASMQPSQPLRDDSNILADAAKGVASGSLAFAGGVGNIFDVPGSVIRDLATWVPGGIAARNPLDQLLPWNWASSDGRTTEEELLESIGAYDDGPSENRSALTSVGRFAGELGLGILMDPLTYITGGATAALRAGGKSGLKAAAKAAKKIGLVDDAFAAPMVAVKKIGTEAAGGQKKLGRELGKREAMTYATLEGYEKATMQSDKLSDAAKKAKISQVNDALRDEMGKAADDAAAFEKMKKKPFLDVEEDGYFNFGVGIPFTNVGYNKSFFKGEKARKLARGVDTVGEYARFKNPIGLQAAAIFSKPMRGNPASEAAQRQALDEVEFLREATVTARGMLYEPIKKIDDSRVLDPTLVDEAGNPVRTREDINKLSQAMTDYLEDIGREGGQVIEGTPGRVFDPASKAKYREYLKSPLTQAEIAARQAGQKLPAHRDYSDAFQELDELGLLDALDEVKAGTSKALDDTQAAGVGIEGLDDPFANYATRVRTVESGKARSKREKKRYDPNTEFATRRQDHLRNHQEGTSQIQRMSLDPEFAGIQHKSVVKGPMKGNIDMKVMKQRFAEKYDLEAQGFTDTQIDALWNDISKRDRNAVNAMLPFFEQNPAAAALRNAEGLYQAAAQARGLKNFLKKVAKINPTAGMQRVMRESNVAFGADGGTVDQVNLATADMFGAEAQHYWNNLYVTRTKGDGVGGTGTHPRKAPSPDGTTYPDADLDIEGGDPPPVSPVSPSSPGGQRAQQSSGSSASDETRAKAVDMLDKEGPATQEDLAVARELLDGDDDDLQILAALQEKDGWENLSDELEATDAPAVTEATKAANQKKASKRRNAKRVEREERYGRTYAEAKEEAQQLGLSRGGSHDAIEARIAEAKAKDDAASASSAKTEGDAAGNRGPHFEKYGRSKNAAKKEASSLGISVKRGKGKKAKQKSGDVLEKEIADAKKSKGLVDETPKKKAASEDAPEVGELKHTENLSPAALKREAEGYGLTVQKGTKMTKLSSMVMKAREKRGLVTAAERPPGKGTKKAKAAKKAEEKAAALLTKEERASGLVTEYDSAIGSRSKGIGSEAGQPKARGKGKVKGSPRPAESKYQIMLNDDVSKQRISDVLNKNLDVPDVLRQMAKDLHGELAAEKKLAGGKGKAPFISPYRFLMSVLDENIENNLWGDVLRKIRSGEAVDPQMEAALRQNREDLFKGMVSDGLEAGKQSRSRPSPTTAAKATTAEKKAPGLVDTPDPSVAKAGKVADATDSPASVNVQQPAKKASKEAPVEPQPTTDEIAAAALEDDLTNPVTGRTATPAQVQAVRHADPEAEMRAAGQAIKDAKREAAQVKAQARLDAANASKDEAGLLDRVDTMKPAEVHQLLKDPDIQPLAKERGINTKNKIGEKRQLIKDALGKKERTGPKGASRQPMKTGGLASRMTKKKPDQTSTGETLNQPIQPSKQSMAMADTRVGMAKGSRLAAIIESSLADTLDPVLGNSAKEVSSIIEEIRQPGQSLVEVLGSSNPAMQRVRLQLAESGRLDLVLSEARKYDRSVRSLNVVASQHLGGDMAGVAGALKAMGVVVPQSVKLGTSSAYDFLIKEAARLREAGNEAAADFAMDTAMPLHDLRGLALGSRQASRYSNPVAVANLASMMRGGNIVHELGYDSMAELIEDSPDVFASLVDGLKDDISNSFSDSVDFGTRTRTGETLYQTIAGYEDMDAGGFFEVPFYAETSAKLDGMRDAAKVDFGSLTKGMKEDEIAYLRLEELYADGGVKTKQQIMGHIERHMPIIQVVNLGKTNRQQFSNYVVPGGDPSSYFEILIKHPEGYRGEEFKSPHFAQDPKRQRGDDLDEFDDYAAEMDADLYESEFEAMQAEFGMDLEEAPPNSQLTETQREAIEYMERRNLPDEKDITDNIISHLRGNVITLPDGHPQAGQRVLRIQELQSDYWQKHAEIERPFNSKLEVLRRMSSKKGYKGVGSEELSAAWRAGQEPAQQGKVRMGHTQVSHNFHQAADNYARESGLMDYISSIIESSKRDGLSSDDIEIFLGDKEGTVDPKYFTGLGHGKTMWLAEAPSEELMRERFVKRWVERNVKASPERKQEIVETALSEPNYNSKNKMFREGELRKNLFGIISFREMLAPRFQGLMRSQSPDANDIHENIYDEIVSHLENFSSKENIKEAIEKGWIEESDVAAGVKAYKDSEHIELLDGAFHETESTLKEKRMEAILGEGDYDDGTWTTGHASGKNIDSPGHTGITHKNTWEMLGMKTALHVAAKNGMSGIALVDGNDIALAVGGPQRALRNHYVKMGNSVTKHLTKLGIPKDAAKPSIVETLDESVQAKNIKLDSIGNGAWSAGHTAKNEPIHITEMPSDAVAASGDRYMVMKKGKEHTARSAETIEEAKEVAADFMNEDGARWSRGWEDHDMAQESDFTRKSLVWMIDDTASAEILRGQSMFQANQAHPGNKAAIHYPGDVPSDRWMESQFMTEITAYDQADPFSYAHEMGHLWRKTLGVKAPEMLDEAERLFGINNGNWSGQYVPHPVTGKNVPAEEAFADAFMEWVKAGGKSPDSGLQKLWSEFKNFIDRSFRRMQKTDAERALSPEMHEFFDNLLGEARYTESSRKTLMDVLDETKYANTRALNLLEQEFGPDQMSAAKELVYAERIRANRLDRIEELRAKGVANPEQQVVVDDEKMLQAFNKELANYGDPKDIPKEIMGIKTKVGQREALQKFSVPEDVAADIARVHGFSEQLSSDTGRSQIVSAYDRFTNIFKTNVTAVWPSFHSRNFTSGYVQNALNDVFDPTEKGWKKYWKPYQDAGALQTGKTVKNASDIKVLQKPGDNRVLNDEQATEEIRRLIWEHQVMEVQGQHRDITGMQATQSGSIIGSREYDGLFFGKDSMFRSQGRKAPTTEAAKRSQTLGNFNPLDVSGGLRSEGQFGPERYGRVMGDIVEGGHRIGGFIALMRQGYSPEEAAKRIKMIHVDYSDLTDVEKKYLRRAIPFYSFSKGMSKYLAGELTARPGGKVAQSVRAANITREPDQTTPDYISQGVSLPFGSSPDGTKHFITGLGLMHEQPLQLAAPFAAFATAGNLNPSDMLYKAGSNLNPAIKAPLELLFDESMFQQGPHGGRDLDSMDPLIGRTMSNVGNTLGLTDRTDPVKTPKLLESVVSNSPVSRVFHTARKATDPRKGLLGKATNTLTGVSYSSVSPAAQDAILRERAAEIMQQMGGRVFERSYIPDYELERMDPETRAQAEQWMELMKTLANRAKERRAIRNLQEAQLK